jgi:quinol monooxygenase YgiN
VTLTFATMPASLTFLSLFKPLAEHVRDHEPGCLAYHLLRSDKDPLKFNIVERYADKEEAFEKVHRTSAPFLSFRSQLKLMEDMKEVVIEGQSYEDTGVGFSSR